MPDGAHMTADDIIRLLDLLPHPEGGHFRETFRDAAAVGGRSASTAIYFLLRTGEVSRWHAVDAGEGWHYYSGAPLLLEVAPPNGPAGRMVLGTDLANAERPQAIVPHGYWQRARSLGAWTLVGCTVAPGFEFAGFSLAPEGFEPGT
jgi:predicted cupin superfamily sugar epimerase